MPLSPLYEIYEVRNGQWILAERFSSISDTSARDRASAHFDVTKTPCLLIEETEDSDGEIIVRIAWSSAGTAGKIRPPGGDADLTSRFMMVAMGGIGAGAIGAIVASAAMSAARGSASGIAAIIAFLGCAIGGMLVMFRIAVPTEIFLWRNKPPSTREKVIELLTFGNVSSVSEGETVPPPQHHPEHRPAPAPQNAAQRTGVDQTADQAGSIFDGDDANSTGTDPVANIDDLIASAAAALTIFVDQTFKSQDGGYRSLSSREQHGIQIYVTGAAQELADHDALTPQTTQEVLAHTLSHAGMDSEAAAEFASKLYSYAYQNEFASVLAAGRAAMKAQIAGIPIPPTATLSVVLAAWAPQTAAKTDSAKFMVLLASTLDSIQATNPQRAWRSHDSMVRIALKIGRGTELRSGDDGILASFADATAAVATATEIQQSAAAFARENPTANFALKIGVHAGDVAVSEDSYGGATVAMIARLRTMAKPGEIVCSEWIRSKTAGTVYRYVAAGTNAKDGEAGQAIFKLLWEPKRVYAKGALEYRSIGAKPKPGEDK